MNTYWLAGLGLAISVVSGSVGYRLASSHYLEVQSAQQEKVLEDSRIAAQAYANLQEVAAQYSSDLEIKNEQNKTLSKQLSQQKTKIVTRKIYTNVCIDADGVLLINSALGASTKPTRTGKLSSKVP